MPIWIMELTSSQWWASSRHYITFVIGIFGGALVTLAVMATIQQANALTAINEIADSLNKLYLMMAAAVTVLGPIINGIISSRKASPASNIETVRAIAADPTQHQSTEAKVAVLSAAASLPEVQGPIVVTDKKLAEAVPSETVIAAT